MNIRPFNPIQSGSITALECDEIENTKEPFSVELEQIFAEHEISKEIAREILKVQKTLSIECCIKEMATANHPEFYLTQDTLYLVKKSVGKGGQSTVYQVCAINTSTNETAIKILKTGLKSYLPEAKLFSSNYRDHRIDHIEKYYEIKNAQGILPTHMAVFEYNGIDFACFQYQKLKSPIFFMASKLADIVNGLAFMHSKGIVHRDIKGANLLSGKKFAKITDTGIARKLSLHKQHHTGLTPFFAAPFIWENLSQHIARKGYQGKEADLFALGRTIQYDFIYRFFVLSGKKNNVKLEKELKELYPLRNQQPRENLDTLQEEFKDSIVIIEKWDEYTVTALIFPNESLIYQKTLKIVKLFKNVLSLNERKGLKLLAKLAFRLQNKNIKKVPSIPTIDYKIRNIQKTCLYGKRMSINPEIQAARKKFDFDSLEFDSGDPFPSSLEEDSEDLDLIQKKIRF